MLLRIHRLSSTKHRTLSTLGHCMDQVKSRDYENYLTNLLLPSKIRACSFAVRAFNAEISSIRDSVNERLAGQMRMKYWEGQIEDIFKDPLTFSSSKWGSHPVAIELARAVHQHDLPKEPLLKMLQSRERFLESEPFKDLKEIDDYATDSFSSVYYLLLRALRSQEKGHARHAANQLGKAQGAYVILRSIPYHAVKGRIIIPSNLLRERSISQDSIRSNPKFKEVVELLASRAEEHIENCRFRAKYLSREEKLLLLPLVPIDNYLNRLHKADIDVFSPELQKRNHILPLTLLYHKIKGTY